MNKLQLSILIGFVMGILIIFGFETSNKQYEIQEILKEPQMFVWPDTTDYIDSLK